MSTPSNPIKVGPFNLGMNNRLPDTELRQGKGGTFLRSAVNTDLTVPGTLKRRQGFAQSLVGTDCHSLWTSAADATYVADGTTLYYLSGPPEALVKTAVLTNLTKGVRVSYIEMNNVVYMTTDNRLIGTLTGAVFSPMPTLVQTDPNYSHLIPLPAGSIIRSYAGRLMTVVNKVLFYTEAFSLMHDGGKGFIPFASDIAIVEALIDGIYVGTLTEAFYFGGNIIETEAKQILAYGSIPGSSGVYPDQTSCFWMSSRGLVQGSGGVTKNMQESAIATNSAKYGASMFREQDGLKQVVTSTFGSDISGAAAYSYMDAEVIRKGTVL